MNDGRSQTSSFGCVAAAWQAHERELRAFLRRRAQDADLADDVLQDVFVKAMREGRAFCMLGNPRAWLFQVARNALVDRFRTSHVHESLTDDLGDSLAADVPATAPVDALAECLSRTLGELSPDDAAILRACDIEGQSQRAFADAHGLSLAAAKSRLLRARRRLRERISLACQVRFEPDGRVASHVARPQAPAAVRQTRCILVPVRSSSQAEPPE